MNGKEKEDIKKCSTENRKENYKLKEKLLQINERIKIMKTEKRKDNDVVQGFFTN